MMPSEPLRVELTADECHEVAVAVRERLGIVKKILETPGMSEQMRGYYRLVAARLESADRAVSECQP